MKNEFVMALKRVLILSLMLLIYAAYCRGEYKKYNSNMFVFEHVGLEKGLSSQRVFSIVEDANGVMWVGTKNGVDRYNGKQVHSYSLLVDRYISNACGRTIMLLKTIDNKLYAFDNKGFIFLYNSITDCFENIYDMAHVVNGEVILNHVYADEKNVMWMGMSSGLYMKEGNDKYRHILKGVFVNHISKRRNELLVSTTTGLYAVRLKDFRCRKLVKDINVQMSYYDEKTGLTWLGTFSRTVMVTDGKKITPVSSLSSGSGSLPSTPVRAIVPYNDKVMLLGVDGGGVYAASRNGTGAYLLFNADEQTGSVLHGNGVYDICLDKWNNIWVGTYSGGVDIAYPAKYVIETFLHENGNPQSLQNDNVNSVLQTPDGNIWFATDKGISLYNPFTGLWRHTLTDKVALTLCQGASGEVLAGTYGHGVYAIDSQCNSRQIYSVGNGILKTDFVSYLYKDANGSLWIGCIYGNLVEVSNAGCRYYDIQQVQSIVSTPGNESVSVGTAQGLYQIDKKTHKVKPSFYMDKFANRDINCYVQSILFTDKQRVWIATDGGGIYVYDLKSHDIISITTDNRLPSNYVYALTQDANGRIFASTDRGLALILPNKRPEAVNLGYIQGLAREYKRMSVATLNDGRLMFGSSNGAVIINPIMIKGLDYRTKLNLTRITLLGVAGRLSDKEREHLAEMLKQGKISLGYSHNTFDIDFESINYRYQHDIAYQYMLEGFDKEWHKSAVVQTIRYTNLPAGSYRLYVRSVSLGTGEMLDEKKVDIRILQPWWNSWPAWMFYIAMLSGAVWFAWYYYKNAMERKYFNEKFNFFVHAAHDIRTPLSLVLAPLDDIAEDSSLSGTSRNYLDIAQRNGKKLLNMITRLLDFQKSEQFEEDMSVIEMDLKTLLSQQIENITPLANQRHIIINLDECPEHQSIWMDRNMADKIFNNLLSNAVKYSLEEKTISVRAWIDNDIYIAMADNGIGIPKSAQKHIFQNFYRADNAVNSQETGSGLGLMLTQRLVHMHQGAISFVSEEGRGTTFTLKFKQGNRHLEKYLATGEWKNDNIAEKSPSKEIVSHAETTDGDILLFVDDNMELRNYVSLTFSKDYRVITKASAEEALDFLKDGICDIVVSDVMMPGMDGDELCRLIKEEPATSYIPVILLTAKADRDFLIDGLGKGADDYIAKPFDIGILKSKIESILANRRRLSKYYLSRSLNIVRQDMQCMTVEEQQPLAYLDDKGREFVDKVTRIVIDNLQDEDFCIDRLCQEMAMSRTLFYSRLKTLTAKAPQDFIRMIRLEKAASLLRNGTSVLDVSVMTGFANSKHFSTVFKKYFGVSPSKYH